MVGLLMLAALIVMEIACAKKNDEEFAGFMLFARPVVVFIAVLIMGGPFLTALIWAAGWWSVGFVVSAFISEHSNGGDEVAAGSGASEDSSQLNAIVDEAVMVVNDMVYAAYSLLLLLSFSKINEFEEFRGKIYIQVSDARPVGSKIDISLRQTRDIQRVLDDFDEQRKQGLIHQMYEDDVRKARLFTYKYGKYCVENEYGDHEVRFSVTNPLFGTSRRNNSTEKLFALIKTAIRERCDGVECSGDGGLFIVYIKSVKSFWDKV